MLTLFNSSMLPYLNHCGSAEVMADGADVSQDCGYHHLVSLLDDSYSFTNALGSVIVDDGGFPEEGPQRDPDTFLTTVISLLPDLCPEYAQRHGHEYGWDPELFLNRVLEEEGNGTRYPRSVKKRKRVDEDADDNAKESKLQKLRQKYENQPPDQYRGDAHYAVIG